MWKMGIDTRNSWEYHITGTIDNTVDLAVAVLVKMWKG